MVCSCIWILTLVFAVSVAGSVVASQHVTQTGTQDNLSLLPNNNVVWPQQHAKHEGGMDRVQRTRRRLSQPTVYNFHTRTSGRCGDSSIEKRITSSSICGMGAAFLGWSDTSASSNSWNGKPKGCSRYDGELYFNTYSYSTPSCSGYNVCICQNNCEAGKYQNGNDQSSCKTCVAGQYSDFGQKSCARCPAGKLSSRLGVAEFGFIVTIGVSPGSTSKTVTVSSTPSPHLSYSFPTPVSVTRIICPSVVDKSNGYPAGSFSDLPNTYQISVNGLDVTARRTDDSVWDDVDLKFICRSDDHCEDVCPASTWSANTGLLNVNQCKSCPEGKSSQPGSSDESACGGCPLGSLSLTANNGSTTCDVCAAGFYLDEELKGQSTHTRRLSGMVKVLPNNNVVWPQQHAKHEGGMDRVQRTRRRLSQPTVYNFHTRTSGRCGDSSIEKRITSSSICGMGAAFLGWSDTSASSNSWNGKPKGCSRYDGELYFNTYSYSTPSCSGYNVCICQNNCEAGKYQNGNDQSSCKTCVAGQYSDFGQKSCARCPAGKLSSRLGVAEFGFIVTIGVSPGSTSKTVTVSSTPSPHLSYSFPTPVSVTRIICPSVVDKSNGYPAGSFSDLPNTYQISVNGLDVTARRTDDSVWDDVDLKFICRSDDHCEDVCPAGTWSDATAIIDVQQCKFCPQGKTSQPGASTATACVGNFTIVENTSKPILIVNCKRCPAGKYIFDDEIASTAKRHSKLEYCIPCNGGRWYSNMTQSCHVCPMGKIRTNTTVSYVYACQDCPVDTYNGFSKLAARDKHDENAGKCILFNLSPLFYQCCGCNSNI